MRPIHAALLLYAAAACSGTAPEVEFVSAPLSAEELAAWSEPGVWSAHHEVTVHRTITTASWCRELDADVVRVGSEVTLRVSASEVAGDCPPGEGTWGYMAVIQGLPPGRYDLRVIHTLAAPGRPSTVVLQHPVLVE